jgi:hypothetical protein
MDFYSLLKLRFFITIQKTLKPTLKDIFEKKLILKEFLSMFQNY